MKTFFQEFKDFALKGNVIDLSIAVIMGAAFKAIIDAVVNNLLSPIIGFLTGGIALADLSVTLGEVTFQYGALIMAVINFLIIALFLFLIIRGINHFKKEQPAEPTPDSDELAVLKEIRELLKKQA
ncbi:MAG: large conductance mechanosensitive channel protein MscL [Culicoidibacterales bacterium]